MLPDERARCGVKRQDIDMGVAGAGEEGIGGSIHSDGAPYTGAGIVLPEKIAGDVVNGEDCAVAFVGDADVDGMESKRGKTVLVAGDDEAPDQDTCLGVENIEWGGDAVALRPNGAEEDEVGVSINDGSGEVGKACATVELPL